MLRQLSAALVIWIGLLGAALPALACPQAAQHHDCCPPGAPSPCDGGPAATICCVSAPSASQPVSINATRSLHEAHAGPGESPDVPVLLAWIASSMDPAPRYDIPMPAASAPPADAALTYLHTGRLRL